VQTPASAPAPAAWTGLSFSLSDAERDRVRANVGVCVKAGIVGSALGAAANLLSGRATNAVPLVALCALCGLALWILRRGRERAAAVTLLVGLVASIHAMLVLGQGVHDRAALLYPATILMAALLLDRRLLVATTALCVLSAAVVAGLEQSGALRTPWAGRLGWLPVVDLTIILVVTAVAVHRLVADVVRGIAEQRTAAERLAATNRALEARSAELERFTYVVSHDLKSPLVTIRGFLSYVEQDARKGEQGRLGSDVARIRGATDKMEQLLEDLLELSRTGRIDRPHEAVPFDEVVREARALVDGRLASRGVRVEVQAGLPTVRGDRRRLVDLVQNLLENAAKFMGERPDPTVWIGAEDGAAGLALLHVRDNGIGIESRHHARIFDLFQRLDPKAEGTGLGLALAQRIVETHGGRIWVESAGAGRGSRFCFTLPTAPPAA
jgi:signal transduction histidine kinase